MKKGEKMVHPYIPNSAPKVKAKSKKQDLTPSDRG